MAVLILLANLPLATSDPCVTSVYQRMLEDTVRSTAVKDLTLVGIQEAIHSTWGARFGHLPPKDQPKHGTFYLSKGKQPAQPKSQAQWNTAIKPKGPTPKHSEQQNTSNPSSSQLSNTTNPGSSKSKPLHRHAACKKT